MSVPETCFIFWRLSENSCAAWVQAWGSIAGVFAGAGGVWWQGLQAKRASQAQRDADVKARRERVVGLVHQLMFLATDQLESCTQNMRIAVADGNRRLEAIAEELRSINFDSRDPSAPIAMEAARVIEKALAEYKHFELHAELPALQERFMPLIGDGLRLLSAAVEARDRPIELEAQVDRK